MKELTRKIIEKNPNSPNLVRICAGINWANLLPVGWGEKTFRVKFYNNKKIILENIEQVKEFAKEQQQLPREEKFKGDYYSILSSE